MRSSFSRLPALRISATGLVAAAGGGLAGSLLSMLAPSHPPLTLAMGVLAPLPLMIASLGFGPLAGALALVVGSAFVALFDLQLGHLVFNGLRAPSSAGFNAGVFLLVLGLPACLLGVAARRRPVAVTTPQARPEERLLGRVAVMAVLFASLSVSAVLAVAVAASGGLEPFNAHLTATLTEAWQMVAQQRALPKGVDAGQIAREVTILMPPLTSAAAVFFYLGSLWLAGRIAQVSDLLGTSWPDIPKHMRLPRFAALLLAVSLPFSFIGGFVGLFSRIISAALMAALAIQGLAVAHALTRNRGSRVPLLVIVYLTIAALMPWPLLLWGVLGLLDAAFSFRDRQRPAAVRKL